LRAIRFLLVFLCSVVLFSVPIIEEFKVFDIDTGVIEFTNDQVLGLRISTNVAVSKYLISEDHPATPISTDSFWETNQPTRYTLKNDTEELKTIYLYVMGTDDSISLSQLLLIELQ
jgi:hypothetical protein